MEPYKPKWTREQGDEIVLRVVRLAAKYECMEDFWFRTDDGIVSSMVNCNDLFFWGCADCESITLENIDSLEETFAECAANPDLNEDYAALLWVARVRGERPQGAFFKAWPEAWDEAFLACGPEREAGFGNPYTVEEGQTQRVAKAINREAVT